jgi:ribonuclease P protein component
MRKEQRLRRREDFAAVYRKGRHYASDLLAVRALRSDREVTRFGIAAGTALGGAVVRNRVKRRLREGLRALDPAPGWDVVVSARKAAVRASYHELLGDVTRLLIRAGVLPKGERREGKSE